MATRERKATRSNADSPTISAHSSARSDTASPVTLTGTGRTNNNQNNKNKTETTPVRNPLRSTRAGSVAQSQGGSPTEEGDAEESGAAPVETSRLRSTRQAGDEKTPSRGIRKVQATVGKQRNSLPAKMSTRRNSSGRMEAILRACKEDDSGALVTKSKRGRPLGAQNSTSSQPAAAAGGRSLLRRKRVLSAGDSQAKEDPEEEMDEAEAEGEQQEAKAQKVAKLDEAALSDSELSKGAQRRRSVDSVASKCSEATDQSMSSEVTTAVKQELGQEEEELAEEGGGGEEKSSGRGRGRPVGRKRKRGKRSSPVKGGAVEVAVAVAVVAAKEEEKESVAEQGQEEDEEDEEEEEEKGEQSEDQQKVEVTGQEDTVNGDEEEKVAKEEDEKKKKRKKSDAQSETAVALSGELSIKVEPTEEEEQGEEKEKLKDSSPSPVLPSESLSPVSVQQICGQPAFLENNPGIEKDPAVAAEMVVQVQEKEKEKVAKKAEVEGKENQSENVPPPPVDGAAAAAAAEGEQGQEEEEAEAEQTTNKEETETNGAADGEEKATTPEQVKEIKREPESPECSTKKENHLKVLGLLTLQAADKAKHEKARRREILKAFPTPPSFNLQATAGGESDGGGSGGGGGKTGRGSSNNNSNQEYTGTLKTVIKLNRKNGNGASSSKAAAAAAAAAATSASGGRQSLKITFQKGRGKGGNAQNGAAGAVGGAGKDSRQSASEGEEYYTISKEGNSLGQPQPGQTLSVSGEPAGTNTQQQPQPQQERQKQQQGHELPGRKTHNRSQLMTTDCGGSTHSGEGAEGAAGKEENLVIPEKAASFSIHPDRLCQDQCFYCGGKFGLFDTPLHIAQMKSQERQKKILDSEEKLTADSCLCDACYRHVDRRANCPSYKKRLSASLAQQQSRMSSGQQQTEEAMDLDEETAAGAKGAGDANAKRNRGQSCSLCRVKMAKNRSFALNQNVKRLEDTIRGQGIPVQWGITPVVCKLCKFYTDHLMKELRGEPAENKNFAENYRRRLISFYKQQQQQQTSDSGGQGSRTLASQSSASAAAGMDSDASRALSRNPAISIRELFPGEDEMGLQVHLPFGQAGHRTPEGWTRSYSLLQYDEATRQLWDELQRPYGNQSSFIRHLVLLEKYFRNGDLVLSKNASSSAATYSETVQTRLRAFDSVSTENRSLLRQLSNAPITITTQKRGQQQQQQPATTVPPLKGLSVTSPPPLVPTSSAVAAGSKVEAGASLLKRMVHPMPPDLISITPTLTPTATATSNTNSTAATSGTPDKVPANAATAPQTVPPMSPGKRASNASPTKPRDSVILTLPDTLSPQDRKLVNGKSWRPTLMPVEKIELNEDGTRTMFKAADGRLLPSRVQVMSGGKPYHITIYDYNRMCILRREKLIQKAMNSQKNQSQSSSSSSTSTSDGVNNSSVATVNSVQQQQQQQNKTATATSVQIPNTVLEQNSLIPVTTSAALTITATNGTSSSLTTTTAADRPGLRRNSRSSAGINSGMNLGSQITATVTSGSNNNNNSSSNGQEAPPKLAARNWMWNPGDLSWDPPLSAPSVVAMGVDNSSAAVAASLLSRIPKSLTVIPQQKLL